MEELVYLAFTIAVELPIALLLLGTAHRQRVCLAVVGANMVTHPIIWWLLFTHHVNWFVAEGAVALFEGCVLLLLFPKHRLLAAFTGVFMNVVTALIGHFA